MTFKTQKRGGMDKCFYVPGEMHIIEFMKPEGIGAISGESLDQIKARYPGAVLMGSEEAIKQVDAAMTAAYCTGAHEITAERFNEMLTVLPPAKWIQDAAAESFMLEERLVGIIATHFIRIDDRYFEMNANIRTTHAELVKMAAEHIFDRLHKNVI